MCATQYSSAGSFVTLKGESRHAAPYVRRRIEICLSRTSLGQMSSDSFCQVHSTMDSVNIGVIHVIYTKLQSMRKISKQNRNRPRPNLQRPCLCHPSRHLPPLRQLRPRFLPRRLLRCHRNPVQCSSQLYEAPQGWPEPN